mmetsp:Transcript_90437/g.235450  ORF Transcript_90437/g.235450 Transcript_90437/m.235450 type:complete len:338 (-) Transcript_90437:62-1075(-)
MEKYRQFGDGGTGANPFVPTWSHYKLSLPLRVLKVLVMLPVSAARLALFVVAVIWLAIVELVCSLIPIGIIRYPVYRLLTYFGCAAALFAVGVVPAGNCLADHRRLKIPPAKETGQVFDARRGSLVIANQQGFTDVLYLCMKLCPTFVFPASGGEPTQVSLLGALRRAGARRLGMPPEHPVQLKDISEKARASWGGPVVIFPEGARTNGSCVLAWKARSFDGVAVPDKPLDAALVALEYSKTGAYTPHHTVGTAFRHVFWLCFQPWHTVRSVWLPAKDAAGATKGKPPAEQIALLRTVLARMLPGAVEVQVGADKHPEFMAYWDASQRKRYTNQKKA